MARIAMLTSEFAPFHGGIGAYARELAFAASNSGHELTMLAPDYEQDNTIEDADLPFKVIRYRDRAATMRTLPLRIWQTMRFLNKQKFDIIHAVDWPFFIPLRLMSGFAGNAKIILTVHGTEIIYMASPKRKLFLSSINFWKKGWARWVANSKYTADLLLKNFPVIDPGNVDAIPLGVAEQWKSRQVDRSIARASFDLADDRIVIVSLGRVVPRKGHGIIAAALAKLPPEVAARIDWWIVGPLLDSGYADEIAVAIAGAKIKAVIFGAVNDDELSLRLSAADVFCLPGYQDGAGRVEGFGLVFLEAAAYGVPAIATRSGGIPEAVKDGVTGILVPEKDVGATADAIAALCTDPGLRSRLAAAARAHAEEATWASVMERTYDVGSGARKGN